MSQQAQIVAFDGAATPVAHTFSAVGVGKEDITGQFADWRELATTVPGYAQATLRITKRILKSGIERVSIDVKIPVMESIAGQNASGYTAAPKVAFFDTFSGVGQFSPRSATVNRRLIRQLLINILGGIATTVTPVTTTNVAELIDNGIMAT